MSDIPIPRDTAQAFQSVGRSCRNFGLRFDRYVGYGPDWSMEGGYKHDELKRLVDEANRWASDRGVQDMYRGLEKRWSALMKSAGAEPFTATPDWRLVVGLGRESAFETGLTLHRVYGCPYVPGSALKGLTKAWAEAKEKPDREIIFGEQDRSGAAIFFDALPVTPPKWKIDVMNPHYPDYYRPGERQPPADWQSPVPVFFATIETGTSFLFGIGARKGYAERANVAREWLQSAMREIGVGGKTTSGYGYWGEMKNV